MNLAGSVAVITGAARGIGKATALEFSRRGAAVLLSDIDEQALLEVRSLIEDSGGKVAAARADVAKEDEVRGLVDTSVAELGGMDVFVSNAGVSVSGPAESIPLEDWHWIVDINMWAHVWAVRACLPRLKAQGKGHLVHIASAAGILGTPALSAYCMTKFAVVGLAESLAVSLQGTGVGVSVVCPLWVTTDIVNSGRVTLDPDLPLSVEESKQMADTMLRSGGIAPSKVGADIADAVEQERFMVLPHPEVLKFAQAKWADPERYVRRAAEALSVQSEFFGEATKPKS